MTGVIMGPKPAVELGRDDGAVGGAVLVDGPGEAMAGPQGKGSNSPLAPPLFPADAVAEYSLPNGRNKR